MNSYLIFHCNLAFSSIPEHMRGTIIDVCYTPMLELARDVAPLGIECTGWTLEQAAALRPQWVGMLRSLIQAGRVEFIGSGYAQIIGPLIPAQVNMVNQRLGQQVYGHILNVQPTLALINEQAFSTGILSTYVENGYTGVVMEWDNPSLSHERWPQMWRYAPQKLQATSGQLLNLLWGQSEIFQQVQRYVHGDTERERFLLQLHAYQFASRDRALCLYSNDAEIFDFRPGRFSTEAQLTGGEWAKMADLLRELRDDAAWNFFLPSQILDMDLPESGNLLNLQSSDAPIPVKKQPKYNILRWAVSGRADTVLNTRCHRLYQRLKTSHAGDADWKQLCFLWSSDLRTHITEERWQKALLTLAVMEQRYSLPQQVVSNTSIETVPQYDHPVSLEKRFVDLATDAVYARLNARKGCALESVVFPSVSPKSLFGTLAHGYFEEIHLAADFFSGHVILEAPGEGRFTDLSVPVSMHTDKENTQLSATINNFYCPVRKCISLSSHEPEMRIAYTFTWGHLPCCSLRLAHMTLNPEAFDAKSLFYATHNGGTQWERFSLKECVNHGAPVSFLVSANMGLGMTEGCFRVGDKEKELQLSVNMTDMAVVALVMHQKTRKHALTRIILSCREYDDTSKSDPLSFPTQLEVRIRASLSSQNGV